MQANWIRENAAGALDPAQAERTLSQIAEHWPVDAPPLIDLLENFPLGLPVLLHLISVSSVCAARLIKHPGILLWLQHSDVCASPRSRRRMLADLPNTSLAEDNFRELRTWKGREMLRIALREVADAAALEETTAELSQLAEICVRKVFEHWDAELRTRIGSPAAKFAVLGLGKLGGGELNHSSDIDVIFLYSEEGQVTPNLTNHQWFNRLGTKIFETFSAKHNAGPLFRMDLRLRPEGSAGPMARSLESLENYYAGFGESWERLALIKARLIAGDAELGYDFLREHQGFIFPRSPTPELLDEIAAIKHRIERDIVGHEKLERNVKLGRGGIREIEFVVQALQLLHGARNAFLQDTSTLKVLPVLAELDLLPREETRDLERAYRFLRRVEHRLQIEAEQQTHTVPDAPAALRKLSQSLGFQTPEAFNAQLHEHTQRVRSIFSRVIGGQSHEQQPTTARLDIFRDEAGANRALAELGQGRGSFHVAPRTRQIFRKLRPLLLEWLREVAEPDATLTQFVRFVEAYGMRSLLFELLVANPRLLELLVKTIDASRYATDTLVRRPQLLEEVTRSGMLDSNRAVERHLIALQSRNASASNLEPVRTYRQMQQLRITIRDVLGLIDEHNLETEQTALAEACLTFVHGLLASESDLTVIALGKFGGAELSYGADLDVIFVGENTRATHELLVEMGKPTSEGAVAQLDPRLRPDGEKGMLTASLSACEAYYWTRAQLWEIQALTRARPVCGPHGEEFVALAQTVWRTAGKRDDLFLQIDAMRERIRRDRRSAAEGLDYKTGLGGLVEAEFLVQALQMRTGAWNPSFGGALEMLQADGSLGSEHANAVRQSYEFLRRCDSVLRRANNKAVSVLPSDDESQRVLAKRVGTKDVATFGEEYRAARETIHRVYVDTLSNFA